MMDEKIFTILSLCGNELKRIKKILKQNGIKRRYYDVSKKFTIYGFHVVNITLICTDETFNKITEEMGGTRIY